MSFTTTHLRGEARLVAELLMRALTETVQAHRGAAKIEPWDGGNNTFWMPADWAVAPCGGEFGHDSILVVVHDGGDLSTATGVRRDHIHAVLGEYGYTLSEQTCWYSAVYRS